MKKPIISLSILVSILMAGAGSAIAADSSGDEEKNKKIVREWIEEVAEKSNLSHHDKNAHEDLKFHLPHNWKSPVTGTNKVEGKAKVKAHLEILKLKWASKATDVSLEIDSIIAEGDTVAVWGHRMYKDKKTNEKVKIKGMAFYKIKDGKVIEIHVVYEGEPLLQD